MITVRGTEIEFTMSYYELMQLSSLMHVKVPVIVVGCMVDLRYENQLVSQEQAASLITQQFCEIKACIDCSAYRNIKVLEVFCLAQKAVLYLYPIAPLFDEESQTLKPRCERALKRIFSLSDHDRDGALSDAELNDFQVKCFNAPLQPYEIFRLKKALQKVLSDEGPLETTWTVLRKFGYNDDIKLADDLIPHLKRAPDQSVELTNKAIDFLEAIFDRFDGDFWALMTLLNPTSSVKNLMYIGYPGDLSTAIRVTRRRHVDRKKQHSERNVLQCFIFGPRKAGKSALLNSFIR
ncbi:mitochondrial rho GTPase 1-like protein, partial [Trifolium pratense]